ncbi:unnamed protein product [Psylliodes chrysocephalus]|uniref:Uncharacterized protein n=1 Tax=Psylliodes chrysocephalus TaxID=3402493 RepID=A0A9P0CVM4_9CUCU|nr:unnamed protein product [Psylliodes chrysocephala]
MEQGFVKADSNNLPRVDYFIDYISAKYRNVKSLSLVILKKLPITSIYLKSSIHCRAARSCYDEEAIDYVQLKREDDVVVVVNGRITSEHRVRLKLYEFSVKIVTKIEKNLISIREDCTVSLGIYHSIRLD